jgi:hypothetical protein
MGRSLPDDDDDKNEKTSEKGATNASDTDTDSDLDEEQYIVEKIMKMRTTKKGKVQCKKLLMVFFLFKYLLFKICSNGKVFPKMKIHG